MKRKIIEKASEIADTDITLQVSTESRDHRFVVPREMMLRALALQDLTERRHLIMNEAYTLKAWCELRYVLVMDGHEDVVSWAELEEQLRNDGVIA